MLTKLIDNLGEWNPQLFRELKGRLKPRYIAIAATISIVGQFLIYLYYLGSLPISQDEYHRYCTGSPPPSSYQYSYSYSKGYCITGQWGNIDIFHQLWWLDMFICLSVIGIFVLLLTGIYMLITDLSKEEQRGTLNFIRLSPQTAKSIFIGKILGVPILLYLVIALALPLHLIAGLSAHIPLHLILMFYGVLGCSCALFYNLALWFGLISRGLGGFQAWLVSGGMFGFLSIMTSAVINGYYNSETLLDWLVLFYPGTVLSYLVDSTFLPQNTVGYLNLEELEKFLWYGQALWTNIIIGVGFIVFNFVWWTFWVTRSIKRRFHNPLATVLSKGNSYWISGSFVLILLGFALQDDSSYSRFWNFVGIQVLLMMLFLLFMALLSPQRQALQDWASYRHQETGQNRTLAQDLIFGDKSPSTIAILLNLGVVMAFLLPAILLSNLEHYTLAALTGLLLEAGMIIIYALIVQRMLLTKTAKPQLMAAGIIGCLIVIPLVCFGIFGLSPEKISWVWFFSVVPGIATESATGVMIFLSLLAQWLTISLLGFQMQRSLRHAGESQTKRLLAQVQ
jgi:hypothetical protein